MLLTVIEFAVLWSENSSSSQRRARSFTLVQAVSLSIGWALCYPGQKWYGSSFLAKDYLYPATNQIILWPLCLAQTAAGIITTILKLLELLQHQANIQSSERVFTVYCCYYGSQAWDWDIRISRTTPSIYLLCWASPEPIMCSGLQLVVGRVSLAGAWMLPKSYTDNKRPGTWRLWPYRPVALSPQWSCILRDYVKLISSYWQVCSSPPPRMAYCIYSILHLALEQCRSKLTSIVISTDQKRWPHTWNVSYMRYCESSIRMVK